MKLSTYAISDPGKISEIQEQLDEFIIKNSENPFLLSAFMKKEMESALHSGFLPVVLVFSVEGKIVSLAPLLVKKRFGVGFASMLFEPWFTPDFISEEKYSSLCMENSLTFIFDHLQCQFETLALPGESANLPVLERICENENIAFRKKSENWLDHCIVSVDKSWADFQNLKNRNFRRRFKRIEQQLDNSGKWQILLFENEDNEPEVIQKILAIEKSSWKQNWRTQHGSPIDEELLNVWEGSVFAVRTYPDFRRSVWFLELNGQTIAYTLVVQYKGKAYTFKTSFDNQYRRLSPGIYLKNVVLRDLFNSGRIKVIDFMTNLPFQERWTHNHLSRFEFHLSKGLLPNLFDSVIQQTPTKKLRSLLPKSLDFAR